MLRGFGLVLAVFCSLSCGTAAEGNPCQGRDAYLYVDTAQHRLWLCEGANARRSYDIRLGKGGVGKTREGDGKVPLGTYGLGKPRASDEYGTFIPIKYPTTEQRALGYTGSAVGVHGPNRDLRWLGRLINLFDTTDGCVGLATDEEMIAIAEWGTSKNASIIELK